eukprot:CAMPEP_0172506468 /NCGR_PEP_ID=MMETSP1066-20121228/195411_1 /TAXON_ID=671091 /ORGANISM="Coscinodiscus wailesii, Strain CCMP2513" /LENGTH=248 /DNA_ID=CAMNT_0013283515 /DNA_START=46 /DNA_END=788 /DNA_ORIENTATION=+
MKTRTVIYAVLFIFRHLSGASSSPSINDGSSGMAANGNASTVLEEATRNVKSSHRRFLLGKKKKIYKYFDWNDIHESMVELAETYPELVTLSSGQDEYDLASAGGIDDCPLDDDVTRRLTSLRRRQLSQQPGCKNYFFTILDSKAHYSRSPSLKTLPTLLFIGTMDGTNAVGPTAVLEFSALLLEATRCESLPHDDYPGTNAPAIVMREWLSQVEDAKYCRKVLKKRGVSDDERRMLARWGTTRRIIV